MSKSFGAGRALRLLLIVLAVVAGIGLIFWLGESQDRPEQPSPLSGEITAIDHVKGPENAAVTLVEYSDLQCPACANFHPLMEAIVAQYPEDVRFVYRHFPLMTIHPRAFEGAQAAEAAHQQGKFFEMVDLLFTRQTEWSTLRAPYQKFEEYAKELNLDTAKFYEDYRSGETAARIRADIDSGNQARISSTPTFFINGQPLPEDVRNFDGFVKLIEQKIAEAKTAQQSTATPTDAETK